MPFAEWWKALDTGERLEVMRLMLWAYMIFGVAGFMIFSGPRMTFFIVILNPLLALIVARLAFALISWLSRMALTGLTASGGDPYKVGFSLQDAMVVRGEWRDAVASYRDILSREADNHEARLRLARLLLRNGEAIDEAEAHYLTVRRGDRKRLHEEEVSNALIDFYRTSGRRDALRQELARASHRFRDTPRGEGARRMLQEMAADDATPAT